MVLSIDTEIITIINDGEIIRSFDINNGLLKWQLKMDSYKLFSSLFCFNVEVFTVGKLKFISTSIGTLGKFTHILMTYVFLLINKYSSFLNLF